MTEHHTPSAAVQRFEEVLGFFIGRRRCGHCQKPLGNEPRRVSANIGYHPACAEVMRLLAKARERDRLRRERSQGDPFLG